MGAQFGFELTNIHNDGADLFMGPTTEAITLNAIQVSMGLACQNNESGFAQVLCLGYVSPTLPTFSGTGPDWFHTQPDQFWGSYTINNPNGISINADGPGGEALFSCILKAWFPQPCTQGLVVPLFGLAVPAGSYFVLHADHTGLLADFEAQGVIYYAVGGVPSLAAGPVGKISIG